MLVCTVDLMKAWEEAKIRFDPSQLQDDAATRVRINVSALVLSGVLSQERLEQAVTDYSSRHESSLKLKRGHLLMPLLQMQFLFKKVIGKIFQKVDALIRQHPVQYIYLVGGFAESKMLQMRVKQAFEGQERRVIVPMRPQLMVVKGAVLFGLQKDPPFKSRVARDTYGFDVSVRYDSENSEHVQRGCTKIVSDGKMKRYVKIDAFRSLVQQNTLIRVSDTHEAKGFSPAGDDQATVTFSLYTTRNPTAKWVDEPGMEKIGEVEVPCARSQTSTIAMSFGRTEISAKATNDVTNEIRRAQIKWDFSKL